MTGLRAGVALIFGLALTGCGEPTIAWQGAESPDHRYTASAEYEAPVLDRKGTYVFLESAQLFSRHAVYQTQTHDCVVLKWTGPRALTINRLGGMPMKMERRWKPLLSDDPVTITYRDLTISGMKFPTECMVGE
jgi:hypothetical protein